MNSAGAPADIAKLKAAWNRASSLHTLESPNDQLEKDVEQMRQAILRKIENPSDDDSALDLLILLYSFASLSVLPDYATLQYAHIKEIYDVRRRIGGYLRDVSLLRPLNFLVLAAPGSGKSRLIKSIIQHLGEQKIGYVSFNMSTMRSKADLGRVLDAARNVTIHKKLPLVFLDEFDSDEGHYAPLLPLLWDGELDVGDRHLPLGRSVFFLAGSRPTLAEKLQKARDIERRHSTDDSKLDDLFSRINGTVIRIPSLADVNADHIPDKVVVAMHLLRNRFPLCERVHWGLLWFIAKARFRYEARSIATLIDLITIQIGEEAEEVTTIERKHLDTLPFGDPDSFVESSLGLHLINGDGPRGLLSLWKSALNINATQRLKLEIGRPPSIPPWINAFGKLIFDLEDESKVANKKISRLTPKRATARRAGKTSRQLPKRKRPKARRRPTAR